ncbi:ubiquitin C-terminal hydrolase 22-like [Impatiens glandulifera]|uniref:ubiquitin C-terminal hydrolase 22-like n=1 Tax=Impatiens glandulifera TaxID=253017 RepID=UPI001FB0C562|nr:ubiquitin C-terminal hydrolase 22-like [Impatiens glandulifera]
MDQETLQCQLRRTVPITPNPCLHLSEFLSRHGTSAFRALQECIRVRPLGLAAIRRDPHEIPLCISCDSSTQTRLYACIACATVSCYTHAPSHATDTAGHEISVDVDRAELFCCVCRDQVYDCDFDAAVVLAQTAASTLGVGGESGITLPLVDNIRKRRRVDYRPWVPDSRERAIVVTNALPLNQMTGNVTSSELPWGLRGLNNLGNTCFMNSVLQALLHTPPLRNYFLSDKHNRYLCQQTRDVKKNATTNANANKNSKLCLACDLDAIFSAVFSGDRTPYSPAKFLYSWWQHAANLASYEQQDAHEFFISMLDGIHEKVEKDKKRLQNQGNGDCCIGHKVFSGILRSDVMCTSCGFTSTTYDPCVDISLDLEPTHGASGKKTKSMNIGQNQGVSTLIGCLDHFTRPERLGSDQKFFCQKCKVRQESLKQMSIRKLPLVSCFHIKRFEHSHVRNMSRKVDRYLQFPFSLDMAPYLSSSILRSRYGNRIFSFEQDDSSSSSQELSTDFELFAVVTHTGKLDAGHYVTYLRLNNQWYKCDDAWMTRVNEDIVRAAQGYMIFYVQKMMYYRASEKTVG